MSQIICYSVHWAIISNGIEKRKHIYHANINPAQSKFALEFIQPSYQRYRILLDLKREKNL